MRSLLDVAPLTETVAIASGEIDVSGVSARGAVTLLARFPALQSMLAGRNVNAENLFSVAPDAIAAIIAAGCGMPGNADAEAVADRLSLDDQAALLAVIIKLTMPKGAGPFVDSLNKLGAALGLAEAGQKAQATNSRKQSKS